MGPKNLIGIKQIKGEKHTIYLIEVLQWQLHENEHPKKWQTLCPFILS